MDSSGSLPALTLRVMLDASITKRTETHSHAGIPTTQVEGQDPVPTPRGTCPGGRGCERGADQHKGSERQEQEGS